MTRRTGRHARCVPAAQDAHRRPYLRTRYDLIESVQIATGGTDSAQAVAADPGVEACFAGFLLESMVTVDDQGAGTVRAIKNERPIWRTRTIRSTDRREDAAPG